MTTDLDRALLRRYEPVMRFTHGEQFFPMDAEAYIKASGLWVQRPGQEALRLVESGDLDAERLAQPYADELGAVYFLKLTDPLRPRQMAAYSLRGGDHDHRTGEKFHAGRGRLARVGYGSRIVDALFSLSLLARGRVPGDKAAAATLAYNKMQQQREEYSYHGRVVRQDGWVVLQYWFFYLYNNWRSGFSGANDHEADWEMFCVYLSEQEPEAVADELPDDGQEVGCEDERLRRFNPEWIAYASHDYSGDDLRRRWDDPELELIGGHPVIYAGAGSHASYFSRGEYLTELELPLLSPLVRVNAKLQQFWHKRLHQYAGETRVEEGGEPSNIFLIPFVDYARGDGRSIGPHQDHAWNEPIMLSPAPGWVTEYRGLWGLYARDPFSGEDAPAGPMYNRDGSVRRAWYDPVGWAGLEKVAPPDEAEALIAGQEGEIRDRINALQMEIAQKNQTLHGWGQEVEAMRDQPHLHSVYTARQAQIATLSQEADAALAQVEEEQALLAVLQQYADRLRAGDRNPVRAHIRRAHRPTSPDRLATGRMAEVWAAISVGLMIIGFVALITLGRQYLLFGLVAILSVFAFIEASFRGRLTSLVASITIALAVVSTLVLLYEFFWEIVILAVLVVGLYILWDNLRELTR